jgi:hypothetical protein
MEHQRELQAHLTYVLSFGSALGMTPDDLDNLFPLGASLAV